ncbi:hypothetical protein HYV81_00310 [Candidatus Woesearchaeota archaeon]|nr:hypothetical protein [Candidatus Woesearchaeota archaeon]
MAIYPISDTIDKVKRYYRFSHNELVAIIIMILAAAFIVSFKRWGDDSFDFLIGIKNFIKALLIMAAIILTHVSGQRIAALHSGFRAEHKLWWFGIVLGLILVLVSNGNVWFLGFSGVFIHHMTVHRLGYFRYGTNTLAFSLTSLAGPLSVIFLGTLVKTLDLYVFAGMPFVNHALINEFFFLCWVYAAYNLLPIPPLDGSRIFFQSRLMYVFIAGSVTGYAALVKFFGVFSYIYALLIGAGFWLVYYIVFEKDAWEGFGLPRPPGI